MYLDVKYQEVNQHHAKEVYQVNSDKNQIANFNAFITKNRNKNQYLTY